MTKIEQVAAAMALATNGGKWDDGHYCEDHKALWMKRAGAAIEATRELTEAQQKALYASGFGYLEMKQFMKVAVDAALNEKADP